MKKLLVILILLGMASTCFANGGVFQKGYYVPEREEQPIECTDSSIFLVTSDADTYLFLTDSSYGMASDIIFHIDDQRITMRGLLKVLRTISPAHFDMYINEMGSDQNEEKR